MCGTILGLFVCAGSLAAAVVSVATPYWTRTSSFRTVLGFSKYTVTGLWETCITIGENRMCGDHGLWKEVDWWIAICALEIAGLLVAFIGVIAIFSSLCVQQKRRHLLIAGLLSFIAAVCIGAGVVTFSVKLRDGLENAYIGYYLNIVGSIGLAVSGCIIFCVRSKTLRPVEFRYA